MKGAFDIVVIGAGPAGLAAACEAVRLGKRVAIVDDNPRAGGQVWRQGPRTRVSQPLHRMLGALEAEGGATMFSATRVVAALPPRALLLESTGGIGQHISYSELILATGARERLLPIAGWTLPGVTGAGGLQALIKGGMPVRGERVVIAGTGPLLMAALATARDAGADVLAVIEQAPLAPVMRFGLSLAATPSKLWQASRLTRGFARLRYWTGSVVREVRGDGRVESVVVRRGTRDVVLECDRLACGFGLVPNLTLALALECGLRRSAIAVDDRQHASVPNVWAAGECTGIGGVELACVQGRIAGLAASGAPIPGALVRERARWRRFAARVEEAFALGEAARERPADETLLCRCEDVPIGAMAQHASWRDAKLHTRCGMGPCQGRICGTAAEVYFGWESAPERPPIHPARISTLLEAASANGTHPIIDPSSTAASDA